MARHQIYQFYSPLKAKLAVAILCALSPFVLTGCAQGLSPQARNIDIPPPVKAASRPDTINDRPDSVIYLPLGRDVMVPEITGIDPLPHDMVGPFELRGETLGGALQLILADVDIPIAFQTDQGLSRTVTVTNLKGPLSDVVDQLCSLANLYCAYEGGSLVVKDKQTFTVTVPPMGAAEDRTALMTNIASAIDAITGHKPVVDASNRTIVYEATSRTGREVTQYLQRLRASTSLIIYETYVWEVSLAAGNSSGINWDMLGKAGIYHTGISLSGSVDKDLGTPVSIGLPTKGDVNFTTGDVLKFISSYGAVKTISQPQITTLSGSKAKLRVADKENYVSKITRTVTGDQVTVATDTASVESGFTLEIGSNWDNATVYGDISIILQELRAIQVFDQNPEAIVQLPQTTEREVKTQVRVRPGDSLLIAGLVRERDSLDKKGPGMEQPLIPVSRTTKTNNVELVFLLKPRVIVFTDRPDRFERAPVVSDTEPVPVELRRGHSFTQIPDHEEKTGETGPESKGVRTSGKQGQDKTDSSGQEDLATPVPVSKEDTPKTTQDMAARVPPVDPVDAEALPVPPSFVVQNLFSGPAASAPAPAVVRSPSEPNVQKQKTKKSKKSVGKKSVSVRSKSAAMVPTSLLKEAVKPTGHTAMPEVDSSSAAAAAAAPVLPSESAPTSENMTPVTEPSGPVGGNDAAAPVNVPSSAPENPSKDAPKDAQELTEKLLQNADTSRTGTAPAADLPLFAVPTAPLLPAGSGQEGRP